MIALGPNVVSGLAYQGLTVGNVLLRYSVVCTVQFFSCFISLFLYFDLYVLGDEGIFMHVDQTSTYLDPHQK